MTKAVCSGSFDPVTNGHINIFERASRMFDELVVCVFNNLSKKPFFSIDERLRLIEESTAHIKNLKVTAFSGLLVNYLEKENINIIVRGLRSAADFEYERNEAMANKHLSKNTDTVFLITDPKYSFVSSSSVREISSFGGDLTDLVPECVKKAIALRQEQSIEKKFDLRF